MPIQRKVKYFIRQSYISMTIENLWEPVFDLKLIWWNTGLTPPIKKIKAKSENDLLFVSHQLKHIYSLEPFHILGLCEVSEDDVTYILREMGVPYFSYHFHPPINNRVCVDTCIIFDSRYLSEIDKESWIDTYGRYETIKVGDSITFYISLIDELLTIVASHWPSQLTYDEEHPHRSAMAIGHRQKLTALREQYGSKSPYVILMGDFNVEPFSSAMAKHLLATRDRSMVVDFDDMLYNPFWRHIGESKPHLPDVEVDSIGGTCYSSSDRYRRWANFDQIIFSSEFLRSSSMVLDESNTGIISNSPLKSAIEKRKNIDHLPVKSAIKLRKKL